MRHSKLPARANNVMLLKIVCNVHKHKVADMGEQYAACFTAVAPEHVISMLHVCAYTHLRLNVKLSQPLRH